MNPNRTMRGIGEAAALVVVSVFAVFVSTAVLAGEPRYENLVLSDSKDSAKPKNSFTPNTPKIFLTTAFADAPSGSKLKAVWIAEKTQAAPPNYRIDATTLTAGAKMNKATFSLSRPNAGWPQGDYRLELFINDKLVNTVRFKVVADAR